MYSSLKSPGLTHVLYKNRFEHLGKVGIGAGLEIGVVEPFAFFESKLGAAARAVFEREFLY